MNCQMKTGAQCYRRGVTKNLIKSLTYLLYRHQPATSSVLYNVLFPVAMFSKLSITLMKGTFSKIPLPLWDSNLASHFPFTFFWPLRAPSPPTPLECSIPIVCVWWGGGGVGVGIFWSYTFSQYCSFPMMLVKKKSKIFVWSPLHTLDVRFERRLD